MLVRLLFPMQTVLTRLLYRFSGRRSIRTKRRNIRYRCSFPGILYVSFLASNFRALVDIVVQRDNTIILSVKLFFGLGKVALCLLASSGGRYEEADKAIPPFSNLATLSSINLSTNQWTESIT